MTKENLAKQRKHGRLPGQWKNEVEDDNMLPKNFKRETGKTAKYAS